MATAPVAFPEETRENKNILILYSLVPSTPAYQVITEGIRATLNETYGDAVYLHTEFLESERFPKGEYPRERFNLYNEKYEDVELDLLVCIGVDIVDPVKNNASQKILNLPTITIDFDLSEYGLGFDLKLNDQTSEIGMQIDAKSILNSALALFPDRDSIYFICGTSKADQLFYSATRTALQKFDPGKKYTFLSNISMDEVLRIIRKLSDNTIIVIPGFNYDSKRVSYYNPESVRMISQAARSPVLAYSDMGIGEGSVGGYVLSFKKIGLLAGEIAVRILQGADPASIISSKEDTYDYIYDWRQLKRWGLLESEQITNDRIILFEEINFFKKYRLIIIVAIIFLLLQSLLIVNFVRLYRRQKMVTRQLMETENKFRELVREDRILRIGQLTASLSHELNQPLTAILSTAQAGIRFIDSDRSDPGMMKELFQNIVEDDKRTASILSSLRSMMRLEKREKERINLNSLVEEVIQIYRGESILKEISLELILPELPVYILADLTQIQQVILNLILNAIQSVEKPSTTDRRIIISVNPEETIVKVSVRDYGSGIDSQILDKLFKPFVTTKKEGTGIGLAISHSIITEHGGNIRAENLPDGGALFAFSLNTIS